MNKKPLPGAIAPRVRRAATIPLTSGIGVLFTGLAITPIFATDRYWDPLNDNTYLSTGYTTYAAAGVVWNTTVTAFDANPANATNAAWVAGDDAFINVTPTGMALDAPGSLWFMRIGTTAPTVHNVTYDSVTSGAALAFLANSTAGTNANLRLTGGTNGASTWTVGADDILRLSSGDDVGGALNVGAVNLVNATGVTSVDLVKEGAGRLHIQSTGSSFIGNVRINAGSIQINGNGSLGNVANSVYIADGAMLTANNNSTVNNTRTIFLGPAIGAGTANLDTQSSFNFTVDSFIANNAAGVGSLNKTNSGTLTLNNPDNSYTGVTTLSGGSLRVSSLVNGGVPSTIGASSSAAANLVLNTGTFNFIAAGPSATDRLFTIGGSTNISNNSTLSTSTLTWTNPGTVANTAIGAHSLVLGGTNTGANVFAPALADNGANVLSLVKGGAANWILTGTHTYTGTTTIGNDPMVGGTLEFNGLLAGVGGAVHVTPLNRLSGTGTISRGVTVSGALSPGSSSVPLGTLTVNGSLAFNSGGTLAVNLAGTAASKVTGVTDLNVNNNAVSVTLNAANLPSGAAYDVLEYSGTLAGLFNPAVAVNGLTGLTSRIAFGLDYSAANKIRLTQTGQAKSLTWIGADGANPNTWNVNNVANWNSGGLEKFFDLDTVTFGDTAATKIVDVTTSVTPSAIVMNNSVGNDYVLSGSTGAIIGPASFTKSGAGKLAISGAHTFTGAFAINGGTVTTAAVNDAAVAGPLGQGTLSFGGGTLDYAGPTATTPRPVIFAAGGGTVNIPTGVELGFSAGIGGAGGVTKTGDGTLVLSGNNGFDGPVVVSAGVLKLGNSNSLGTAVGGTTVSAGATLDLAATAGTFALPQDEVITLSGAGVDLNGDTIGDGAIVNNGTANPQNALKKVVLTGDTTFGANQRFDIRIAGPSTAGFVAGTDAYFHANGFSMTKVGTAILGIVGVGETNLADININAGTVIFHDAGNSDVAMMLASDTTLGKIDDGAGNPYTVTIQPGATLQFFNTDGTRSKDIITNGVGTSNATIQMNANVNVPHTLTLNRGITVNGGLNLTSSAANETNLLITGIISDGATVGSITKAGGGTVTLMPANAFTGGTTVNAGVLKVGHDASVGSGPLTLGAGAISSAGTGARQFSNAVSVTGNATLGDPIDNGALTFSSQVDLGTGDRNLTIHSNVTFAAGFVGTGTGGLNQKLGTGTLTIGTGNSISGGVTEVRGGTLVLATGATVANGDAIRVMANTAGGSATFTMHPGSSLEIGAVTANFRIGHESTTPTDGINIANIAGNLSFAAASTAGSVQLGSKSALAQLNLLSGGVLTVRSVGLGTQTPVGAVTEVNFDGGTLRAFADNPAFFNPVLTAAKVKAGGGTIDSNGFAISIAQPLVHDPALGASVDGGIKKTGFGTLTLDGVSTYSGPTVINGGTLLISASGRISESVVTQVNLSGTLSGNGTIRALKLSGGTLAPGVGIGNLVVEDDVEFAGGVVAFEINGINPGTDYDQLVLSGFGGSLMTISAPTELSLALGFTPTPGDSFLLIENVSTFPSVTPSLFTVGGTPVPNGGQFSANGTAFTLHYNGGDGNDLAVVAVPEPGGTALLLAGLGIFSRLRRRRA